MVDHELDLNPALADVEEIIVERPELTQEEWEIVNKATPWVKTIVKPEVRKELEAIYAQKQADLETGLRAEMQKAIKERMDAWAKTQEPLSSEDIEKLLNQEYVEFTFSVKEARGERKEHTFVIREVPKDVEDRFIKIIQNKLVPIIEQVNAAEWTLDGSMAAQLETILRRCPIALECAQELVVDILDPWEEQEWLTKEWAGKNMSIPRIMRCLQAQAEANKYRDFFSDAFQLFLTSRN